MKRKLLLPVAVLATGLTFLPAAANAAQLPQDVDVEIDNSTRGLQAAPEVGDVLVFSGYGSSDAYVTMDAPNTYFQWMRDGVPVSDPIYNTDGWTQYTVTSADIGHQLYLEQVADIPGYDETDYDSNKTLPVDGVLPGFTGTLSVSVSGNAVAGQTLTATPSGLSPQPDSYTYEWTAKGGTQSGTLGMYTVSTADEGAPITVTVTAHLAGADDVTQTVTTDTVTAPQLTLLSHPSITGTPSVGAVLLATGATTSPATEVTNYQWLRNGVPIDGADGGGYQLTTDDLGATISVQTTQSASGYADTTATSAGVGPVAGQSFTNISPVSITGTATVGEILGVTEPTSTPTAETLSYQWRRNGAVIPGATDPTYQPVSADRGQFLTITVTRSSAGYQDASTTSDPVGPVAGKSYDVAPSVAIAGQGTYGSVLTAQPAGMPQPDNISYQWLRDGDPIAGATDTCYTLGLGDLGHQVSVQATYTKADYDDVTVTSEPTGQIAKADFADVVAPTISGDAVYGSTLTLTAPTSTPAAGSISLQWLRDGDPIDGATDTSYTLGLADVGHQVSVQATLRGAGYNERASTSEATDEVAGLDFTDVVAPAVTGSAVFGNTLSVTAPTATPAAGHVTYQWLRDGDPIGGATDTSYTLGLADLGHQISVKATLSSDGYNDRSLTSDPTHVVSRDSFDGNLSVTVSGTAQIGRELDAQVANTLSPAPSDVTYQWLRDGKAINGATGASYTPVAADVNTAVSVVVNASRAGYAGESATSAATGKVAGYDKVTATLTASAATVVAGHKVILTWSTGGAQTIVAGSAWTGTKAASGTETVVAPQAPGRYVYQLRVAGPGGTRLVSTAVTVVRPACNLQVAVSSTTAAAGHLVTVTVKGLAAGEKYTLSFAPQHPDKLTLSGVADESGTIVRTFSVGQVYVPGKRFIFVTGDQHNRRGETTIKVTPGNGTHR